MKPASHRIDRLPRKSLLSLAIALALGATSFGSEAAGLGRINILSSIGQPLRAEIEVTATARDEPGTLSARLASPDAFAQANIDYGAMLATLRFSVQRRGNGTPYVLVTSNQLINEPFLDLLVELNWGAGRLVREYTLLLDPPDTRAARDTEPGAAIVQAQSPAVVTRAPARRRAAPPVPSSVAPTAPSGAGTAPGTSSGDYVVRNGDTALSIARDHRAEGVSVEQMLAALYRDNPQAFSGNIDRLTAGATMKIPDAANARALDAGEARRIVAQTSNFASYRERIAQNAGVAAAARSGPQASGRLTTRVEDGASPVVDAKDRLQLSRPDANGRTAAGSAATRSGPAGPSPEDLAAKDRELQEARTRLALLEKNVADLQQLLTLKNQTLADLQKPGTGATAAATPGAASTGQASAGTAASSTVPAPSAPAVEPAAATAAAAAAATAAPTTAPAVAEPPPAPAAVAPVVAPPAAAKAASPAPAATPPATDSWIDTLKDNALLLVGLLVVLGLIGYGLLMARRRRNLSSFEDSIFVDNSVLHANSVFGTTGGQSVDTANSGFHSNFVPVAGQLPEQSEVDPVAEADVYIAYGRDAQAEEILKEALRSDGSRHAVRLKLLEIYAKRGDAKTFETMASELYAATGGQGDDWKQAAALGRTLDPHNPLYGEAAAGEAASLSADSTSMRPNGAGAHPAALGGATASGLAMVAPGAAAADAAPAYAADRPATATELMRTDPLPLPDATAATSAPSMNLDFDLGFANAGGAAGTPPLTPTPAPAGAASVGDAIEFDGGEAGKTLIEPFTASAFGSGDPSARTAVNLPAFRARAAQEPAAPANGAAKDVDGFSASDIFGTSIIANTEPLYDETPTVPSPLPAPTAASAPASTPASTPTQARTTDFRNAVDSHQFDKTEPLDAFSKINLDLEASDYAATNATPDFSNGTDLWQAMATKLDLALAYSDIGDKDGARELLDEVVRSGDSAQADRARQLIGTLG